MRPLGGSVALVRVVPVDHPDLSIGTGHQVDHLRPLVAGQQKIGIAVPRIAGAFRDQLIDVDAVAVDVVHEEFAVVLLGPGSALVDHRPGMGMAAAEVVAGFAVVVIPLVAGVVPVPGDRLDVVISMRVEVRSRLPLEPTALDDVIQMRNHAGGAERLAVLIEVDSPRVTATVGKDLELMPHRVIPPDPRVDRLPLLRGRPRLSHQRMREHPVTPIQPPIRPPDEGVERLVRVLPVPAIEEDRGSGGYVLRELESGER